MDGVLLDTVASGYQSGEMQCLALPAGAATSLAGVKCLVVLHGRGGVATNMIQNALWYPHIRALAQAGYAVFGIDTGAQSVVSKYFNSWASDVAMTAITNAKTYLLSTRGATGSTKIGFLDYSLGGGQGFIWMTQNPGAAAGVISYAPACDHQYFYDSPVIPAWQAELELNYASYNRLLSGSGTLNQVGSALTVTTDTTPFPAAGNAVAYGEQSVANFLAPMKVAYTSKNATQLLGCTIVSGSISWNGAGGVGNYLRIAEWGQFVNFKPTRSPIAVASSAVFDAVPIHCYVGTLDATLGAAATPASTQVPDFCAAVGSSAVYHPLAGKTHTDLFGAIPASEVVALVDGFKW